MSDAVTLTVAATPAYEHILDQRDAYHAEYLVACG